MRKNGHRDSEHTRALLLDAASKEIHQHGFQAANLDRILTSAGVTKGALYYHFPNKQALGIAVIREVIKGVLQRQMVDPLLAQEDPIDALIRMVEGRMDEFDTTEAAFGCPLNNLIQEMSPVDEDFRKRLLSILEQSRQAIASTLERGKAMGQVRQNVACDEAAMFIMASIEGALGITKAYLSVDSYRGCLTQLQGYIRSLTA